MPRPPAPRPPPDVQRVSGHRSGFAALPAHASVHLLESQGGDLFPRVPGRVFNLI